MRNKLLCLLLMSRSPGNPSPGGDSYWAKEKLMLKKSLGTLFVVLVLGPMPSAVRAQDPGGGNRSVIGRQQQADQLDQPGRWVPPVGQPRINQPPAKLSNEALKGLTAYEAERSARQFKQLLNVQTEARERELSWLRPVLYGLLGLSALLAGGGVMAGKKTIDAKHDAEFWRSVANPPPGTPRPARPPGWWWSGSSSSPSPPE
jgi:hypothetical protein